MSEMSKLNSDNILCSAGRGELSKTACMECALARQNDCGIDYSLLKSMLKTKQRDGIHVTDITKCLRSSYYDKTNATPEWVHMMSYRTFGLALHGYLEGSDEHMYSELPLEALGLVGTADVVYEDGRIIDFKCQPAGEMITMADGTEKPIEKINIFDQVLSWDGEKFVPSKVTAVMDGGIQDVYEIEIAGGQIIHCSGNHPILTRRGWVDAENLIPETDRIVHLENWTGSGEMSIDDARLLGYLIGDGCTSRQYAVSFTNEEQSVLSDVGNIVQAKGWDFTKAGGDHYDWRITNQGKKISTTGPMAFIEEHGMHWKHSYEKIVPDDIMRGNQIVIANFLAGYFDTDGTITDKDGKAPCRLTFTTTSPHLARQVPELLRRLGIKCWVQKNESTHQRTWYQICVWRASNIIRFFVLVPSHSSRKVSRFDAWHPILEQTSPKGGKNLDRVERLSSLGPLQTIGLEVSDNHTYLSKGIITHNTARWITPSRLPYASHSLQVNIYAEMLREMHKQVGLKEKYPLPTSAAIQYIDLSGPTRCRICKAPFMPGADGILRCPKCLTTNKEAHSGNVLLEVFLLESEEIHKIIEERRDALRSSINTHTPPPREEGLCNYCSHEQECYNESEEI